MRLTIKEAAHRATEFSNEQEQLRLASYAQEAAFERRCTFAAYTYDALYLANDLVTLGESDFVEKYGHTPQAILEKIRALQIAELDNDFATRNSQTDFFIDLLS